MTRTTVAVPSELADRPVDSRDGRRIAWTTAIDDDGLPMQGVNAQGCKATPVKRERAGRPRF